MWFLFLLLGSVNAAHINYISPDRGGWMGGTLLTIHGSGFSGDEYLGGNRVYINNQPCELDLFFTTEHRLVCEVPVYDGDIPLEIPPQGNYAGGHTDEYMQVKVMVDGAWATGPRDYRMSMWHTPMLLRINHAGLAGSVLNFMGLFKSNNFNAFTYLIGDTRCDLLALKPMDDAVEDSSDDWRQYSCKVSDQEAGYYNVSLNLGSDIINMDRSTFWFGDAVFHPWETEMLNRMSPSGELYNVAIFPKITSVSPLIGSPNGGTVVTITGTGFSTDLSSNSVFFGEQECTLLSSDGNTMTCMTSPLTNASTAIFANETVPGTLGLKKETYVDITTAGNWHACYHCQFSSAMLTSQSTPYMTGYPDYPENVSTHFGDLEMNDRVMWSSSRMPWRKIRRYVDRYTGLFIAPHTANYTFYLAGNDFVRLSLSPDSSMNNLTVLGDVRNSVDHGVRRHNPSSLTDPAVGLTSAVHLEAGAEYFMEVVHGDYSDRNFFSVAMSHTPPEEENLDNTSVAYTIPTTFRVDIVTNVEREVWQLQMINATGGEFRIYLFGEWESLPYSVSAGDVQGELRAMAGRADTNLRDNKHWISVSRDVTTVNYTEYRTFTIRFNGPARESRPLSVNQDSVVAVSFALTQLLEPSEPLDGYVVLNISGVEVPLQPTNNEAKFDWRDQGCDRLYYEGAEYRIGELINHVYSGARAVAVTEGSNRGDRCRYTITMYEPRGLLIENITFGSLDTLLGANVTATIYPVVQGSAEDWFYDPIPATYLRLALPADTGFPVRVSSNGLAAGFQPVRFPTREGRHADVSTPGYYPSNTSDANYTKLPVFHFMDNVTANVTNIYPLQGYSGDTVDILGLNFFAEAFQMNISIDGARFDVYKESEEVLSLTVPPVPAGTYNMSFTMGFQGTPNLERSATFLALLNLESMHPSTGSIHGGTLLTLTGQGFSSDTDLMTILVGNDTCQVKTASYSRITCLTPPVNTTQTGVVDVAVTVFVNDVNASLDSFSYDDSEIYSPVIESITPIAQSCADSVRLTITGRGFIGLEFSEDPFAEMLGEQMLGVGYAANSTNVRLLNRRGVQTPCLLRQLSPTYIVCTPGLIRAGEYEVLVATNFSGYATRGHFVYNELAVSNVYPRNGTLEGEAMLTITGAGFETRSGLEPTVLLGPITEPGVHCNVNFFNYSTIVCLLNPNNRRDYQPLVGPNFVEVALGSKVSKDCGENCYHSLNADITPTVESISPTHGEIGTNVTISGVGFHTPMSLNTIRLGSALCNITNGTNSTINCTLVETDSAITDHGVHVLTFQGAASAPGVTFTFATLVESLSLSEGSKGGEHLLTITGQGFHHTEADDDYDADPSTLENGTVVERIATEMTLADVVCDTDEVQPHMYVCLTGAVAADGDLVGNVSGRVVKYQKTSNGAGWDEEVVVEEVAMASDLNYTYAHDWTPYLDSINPTQGAIGTTVVITGERFPLDLANLTVTVLGGECRPLATSATEIQCEIIDVPAGKGVVIMDTERGLALSSGARFDSVLTLDTLSPTQVSVTGTDLTLYGQGFPIHMEDVSVTVCGEVCTVVSTEYSELMCVMPAWKTFEHLSLYPTPDPEPLVGTLYSWHDNRMWHIERTMDGDLQNIFEYNRGVGGSIGYDAGEGKAFLLTKFEIVVHEQEVANHKGGMIQGSNHWNHSGTDLERNYTTLYEWKTDLDIGWNTITFEEGGHRPALTESYRFIRYITFERRFRVREWYLEGHNLFTKSSENCTVEVIVDVPDESTKVYTQQYTETVTFTEDSTPEVHSFSPANGTAAGGTAVLVSGVGFVVNETSVSIDGTPCIIDWSLDFSSTFFTCVTGERPLDLEEVGTVVKVSGNHAVITGSGYLYIDPWSSPLTWADGILPGEGDTVYIVPGRNILLDVSPPELFFVLIEGSLIFADTLDLTFDFHYMFIRGGTLQIGTEEEPHQHKVVLTAHGDRHDQIPIPIYGGKMIALRGGKLSIHGQARTPYWTRLSETAYQNQTNITVAYQGSLDWTVGDHIVIAPSGFDSWEAEHRYITAVDGNTLHFNEPLIYTHFGGSQPASGDWGEVDMSSEVGLLSRNIVIQGDSESWRQRYGVHMIFHSPNLDSTIELENFEMTNCGQSHIIGRYPVHFHLEHNSRGSYVRGGAVWHSWNRAVVLHETNHVVVSDVIAYDGLGHLFFVEDGNEEYNTFERCLGLQASPTGGQLSHDTFPSVFWLANPNNNLIDNAAGGSTHMGFWMSPPPHPRARSFTKSRCPFNQVFGTISGNSAHSNGRHGFWIFPNHFPRRDECGADTEDANPFVPTYIQNFTTWKNIEQGVGMVNLGYHVLQNIIAIDCGDAGIEVGDVSGNPGMRIENYLAISRSVNPTGGETQAFRGFLGLRGIVGPKTEGLFISNATFVNYNRRLEYALMTCVRCWNVCSREQGANTGRVEGLTFINTPHRLHFGYQNNDVVIDLDGSLSGLAPGTNVLPMELPHLYGPDCSNRTELLNDSSLGYVDDMFVNFGYSSSVMTCPPEYAFHRITVMQYNPNSLWAYDFIVGTVNDNTTVKFYKSVDRGWATGWVTLLPTHATLANQSRAWMANSFGIDWELISIWVNNASDFKQTLVIDFPYTESRQNFFVQDRAWLPKNKVSGERYTWNLGSPSWHLYNDPGMNPDNTFIPAADGDSRLWWHDDTEIGDTRGRCSVALSQANYSNHMFQMDAIKCPPSGCLTLYPAVTPAIVVRWSDPSSWPAEYPFPTFDPEDMTTFHVIIPRGMTLLIDVEETEVVHRVDVQGVLQFEDSGNRTLHARYILVFGGVLQIGTVQAPFMNNARISLHGNYDMDAIAVDEIHNLGKAVLAGFGEVNIVGAPRDVIWTSLDATAMPGDTTITLEETVDWVAGEQIIIHSTETDLKYAETRTIASVNGLEITLTEPLLYRHYGEHQVFGDVQVSTRAEVGLLSRNVVIEGDESNTPFYEQGDRYGCHVMLGWLDDWGFGGYGTIRGTEIRNCGQGGGSPRGSLYVYRLKRQNNRLPADIVFSQLSIHTGHNYGLMLEESHDVIVDQCVFQGMFGHSGIWGVGDVQHAVFTNNLIGGMRELLKQTTEIFPYDLCAVRFEMYGNTFRNNVIAGSEDMGWCTTADRCDATYDNSVFRDNVAHSCIHGTYVGFDQSAGGGCHKLAYFTAWKNSHIGIFSVASADTVVSHVHIVDNYLGIVAWNSHGGSFDNEIRYEHMIVSGKSLDMNPPEDNCRLTRCMSYYFAQSCEERHDAETLDAECFGIVAGEFNTKKATPVILHVKEIPAIRHKKGWRPHPWGVTYVDNVQFYNFGASTCREGGCRAISSSEFAHDRQSPLIFSNIVWDDSVDEDYKFYFHTPRPDYIHVENCGEGRVCEAQKQFFIVDEDGSLLSPDAVEPAASTLVAIAYNDDGPANPVHCTHKENWNSMHCVGPRYGQLYIESLDDDESDRRLLPLRVESEDGRLQLINQPPDMYMITEWPSFKRPSKFWPTVEIGVHHRLELGDLPPRNLKVGLRYCPAGERIIVNFFYPELYRLQLWHDGVQLEESSVYPNISTSDNLHFSYNKSTREISFVLECDTEPAVEIHQLLAIRLTARLDLDLDFFDDHAQNAFINNIAIMLDIDPGRIRIVEITAGSVIVETSIEDEYSDDGTYNGTESAVTLANLEEQLWAIINATPPVYCNSSSSNNSANCTEAPTNPPLTWADIGAEVVSVSAPWVPKVVVYNVTDDNNSTNTTDEEIDIYPTVTPPTSVSTPPPTSTPSTSDISEVGTSSSYEPLQEAGSDPTMYAIISGVGGAAFLIGVAVFACRKRRDADPKSVSTVIPSDCIVEAKPLYSVSIEPDDEVASPPRCVSPPPANSPLSIPRAKTVSQLPPLLRANTFINPQLPPLHSFKISETGLNSFRDQGERDVKSADSGGSDETDRSTTTASASNVALLDTMRSSEATATSAIQEEKQRQQRLAQQHLFALFEGYARFIGTMEAYEVAASDPRRLFANSRTLMEQAKFRKKQFPSLRKMQKTLYDTLQEYEDNFHARYQYHDADARILLNYDVQVRFTGDNVGSYHGQGVPPILPPTGSVQAAPIYNPQRRPH
jgi:opacity protein-like surface antigen